MQEVFEKWEDISCDPQVLAEYHSRRMAILDEPAEIRKAELREERARTEVLIKEKETRERLKSIKIVKSKLTEGMKLKLSLD